MKQHLFIVLLFTGILPLVLSVPRKYYLIQQGMTWSDAQIYCQAKHTDLAIIESNDNTVNIQYEIQRQQFSSSAWIGLYNDINSWRWCLGNEPLGSMGLWDEGEPNNNGGYQSCGAITPTGFWDISCTTAYPFVCFNDHGTDTDRYIYISTASTWQTAQAYCRQYFTDLACTRNETEYSIIQNIISQPSWVGLFRDTWKWIDLTSAGCLENLIMRCGMKTGYLYNCQASDAECSDIRPFLCYSVITGKQQIIRLSMQSKQDVNDSEVMAVILKQIKQMLMDHEMAGNTTVNWRVQPNGQVFLKKKGNNIIVQEAP